MRIGSLHGLGLLLALVSGSLIAQEPGPKRPDADPLKPCQIGQFAGRCGTISVAENRTIPGGRRIELFTVVVPAREEPAEADPLVILEGGPGAAVSHFGPMHVQTFYGVGARRDLVLLDQRGTGRSAPLECDLTDGFRQLATPERVRQCREQLETDADLAFYSTEDAVHDLADVLDRLGYERANLFGVSNGTRTALHFLRRYPERVRSVTLLGGYPFDHNVLPESGETLDRSLTLLAEDCAGLATCAEAFPRFGPALSRLAERTAEGDPDWDLFTAALRMMLFFPLQASGVPNLVSLVDSTGLTPQSQGPGTSPLNGWISEGAYLATICSEDATRTTVEEVRRRTAGTLLGPGWAKSVVASCSEWPTRPLPEDFEADVVSDVPALLLVGRLDPVMPPEWSYDLAATLPNARVIEVAQGQHSFIGMGGVSCVLSLMQGFIDSADSASLDATCTDAMTRPPFAPPTR